MIRDFNQLINIARERGPVRLVVAAAGDVRVLKAVKLARAKGLVEPVVVGIPDKIKVEAEKAGFEIGEIEVVTVPNKVEACRQAVQMVSSGQGDILMKGLVDTSIIMKAVLDKEIGLRTGRLVSHLAAIEAKALGRLIFITDDGMIIKPDLGQKKEIIENAIDVTQRFGYEQPRVAVISSVEKVNPDMPETVEAAALAKMSDRGQIRGGIVDGPLALDNALSEEAARIKEIKSEVAGKADVLIVPDIVAGNILGKSTVYFAENRIAALVVGTSHPVVVASRSSSIEVKLASIAATVLLVPDPME